MRFLSLFLVAAVVAVPAGASVVTLGGGLAASCYEAAKAQDASRESLAVCDRALAQGPLTQQDRSATLVNRGILLLRRHDVGGANRDFDEAIALVPGQAEAWLNKAIADVRYGKSVDALPRVEKALAFKTRKPALAYFVRAIANEDRGNIAAAYSDLQRARELDPQWQEPVIELQRYKVR